MTQQTSVSAEAADRLSSRINGAYKVLSDGHERGLYLLRVRGQAVPEGESRATAPHVPVCVCLLVCGHRLSRLMCTQFLLTPLSSIC